MKNYNIICMLTIFILIIGLGSCSEESVDTFSGESEIYFRYRVTAPQANYKIGEDSIAYTFSLTPSYYVRDTVYTTLRTIGKSFDVNRMISLKQINSADENAAIPGVHYVPFDSDEMKKLLIAKPGDVEPVIPIILLKSDDLRNKTVRLKMSLEKNDDFDLGFKDNLTFVVTTTRQAIKPVLWDRYWQTRFGKWGTVKIEFIVTSTGFNMWEEYKASLISYYGFVTGKVKDALIKYNAENPDNPLREYPEEGQEIGELVTFN